MDAVVRICDELFESMTPELAEATCSTYISIDLSQGLTSKPIVEPPFWSQSFCSSVDYDHKGPSLVVLIDPDALDVARGEPFNYPQPSPIALRTTQCVLHDYAPI
jgi:hypothetical protein